jgi:hypothetical protein
MTSTNTAPVTFLIGQDATITGLTVWDAPSGGRCAGREEVLMSFPKMGGMAMRFTANGIGKSVFVAEQMAPIVTVNGTDNFASVLRSPDVIVRVDGTGNHANIAGCVDAMAFINGVGNTVDIQGNSRAVGLPVATDNKISVKGANNLVSAFGHTTGTVITDDGIGTTIQLAATDVTIRDFAHDLTGKIDLTAFKVTPQEAVAAERPDGHGGTLIVLVPPTDTGQFEASIFRTIGGGIPHIDFVGVPKIDISHFV